MVSLSWAAAIADIRRSQLPKTPKQSLGIQICEGCNNVFVPWRRDQKIHARSDKGYNACLEKRMIKLRPPVDHTARQCGRCGEPYRPIRKDQRYCSESCQKSEFNEQFRYFTVKVPLELLTDGGDSGILVVTVREGKVIAVDGRS